MFKPTEIEVVNFNLLKSIAEQGGGGETGGDLPEIS